MKPLKLKTWSAMIVNWAPVILWMMVIFILSTELFSFANTTPFLAPLLADLLPDVFAARIEVIVFLIRNLGHWSEHFILAVLLMLALDARLSTRSLTPRLPWRLGLPTPYPRMH